MRRGTGGAGQPLAGLVDEVRQERGAELPVQRRDRRLPDDELAGRGQNQLVVLALRDGRSCRCRRSGQDVAALGVPGAWVNRGAAAASSGHPDIAEQPAEEFINRLDEIILHRTLGAHGYVGEGALALMLHPAPESVHGIDDIKVKALLRVSAYLSPCGRAVSARLPPEALHGTAHIIMDSLLCLGSHLIKGAKRRIRDMLLPLRVH